MMKFIYDSLDTVKHIKHPTKKEYISLTLSILGLAVVGGAYFIFADSIFSALYKMFYNMMQ